MTAQVLADARPDLETTRDPIARLAALVDPGTLRISWAEPGTGAVTATGQIEGRPATAFCSDPSVQGGAMGVEGCAAIADAYDRAITAGHGIIGIWHSGGARLREGVESLHGVGRIFAAMTAASGVIPQISIVLGPAAGGAAYGPALTDIVILAPAGRIFVTGPDVVRSVTGEDVDMSRLGGAEPHGRRSGVVHVVTDSDLDAIAAAREAFDLMGNVGHVRLVEDRPMAQLLPQSAKRAYDVQPLVEALLDDKGLQLQGKWAPNIVTTLGRVGGGTVGVIANNPLRLAGCLDSASAEKAARFVRMCDAFGIPLIVVVDVPGYLPGVTQEWEGVVRRGAKLLHAFAGASVPRVTVITRKAFGGAYIAMNSRSLGATRVLAWPDAEVEVMGPIAAVRILRRRELAEVSDADRGEVEIEFADQHRRDSGGVDRAIALGFVDEMIDPDRTRSTISAVLSQSLPVRGRRGNIPL